MSINSHCKPKNEIPLRIFWMLLVKYYVIFSKFSTRFRILNTFQLSSNSNWIEMKAKFYLPDSTVNPDSMPFWNKIACFEAIFSIAAVDFLNAFCVSTHFCFYFAFHQRFRRSVINFFNFHVETRPTFIDYSSVHQSKDQNFHSGEKISSSFL